MSKLLEKVQKGQILVLGAKVVNNPFAQEVDRKDGTKTEFVRVNTDKGLGFMAWKDHATFKGLKKLREGDEINFICTSVGANSFIVQTSTPSGASVPEARGDCVVVGLVEIEITKCLAASGFDSVEDRDEIDARPPRNKSVGTEYAAPPSPGGVAAEVPAAAGVVNPDNDQPY